MSNAINWFEIPVSDLERAAAFYERVFEVRLRRESMGCGEMAIFPYGESGVGGSLFKHQDLKPSADGVLPYLNAGDDLAPLLARVEAAGGQVVLQRTQIAPEIGYMALFIDSEGNRIGLHSRH